jgi:CRISPR system Cascade subunit CasE
MHFSVITPTPGMELQAVHQLAQGAYSEHQWVWRFFPAEPGTARDHIFRRDDRGQVTRFYVVSKRPPLSFSEAWTVQTRDYAPRLQGGDELEFVLCANPVITRKLDGKHQRHDVVMDAKRRAKVDGSEPEPTHARVRSACVGWITAQAQRHGFDVDTDSLSVEGYTQHIGKHEQLRFSSVDFRGRLIVKKPETFTAMLMTGIGHAKAFGCGLMLVRRPI